MGHRVEHASSDTGLVAVAALMSAGETEETALPRAQEVIAACAAVHVSVIRLFEEYSIDMPASNAWVWPGK